MEFTGNLPSLKLTASLHLRMDGWNIGFLLGVPIFRCYVSFRECMNVLFFSRTFKTKKYVKYPWSPDMFSIFQCQRPGDLGTSEPRSPEAQGSRLCHGRGGRWDGRWPSNGLALQNDCLLRVSGPYIFWKKEPIVFSSQKGNLTFFDPCWGLVQIEVYRVGPMWNYELHVHLP